MNIAILTFDGFNEIDSFVSFHILNRREVSGWKVAISCPSETVRSTNAFVFPRNNRSSLRTTQMPSVCGSPRSREIAEDEAMMSRLNWTRGANDRVAMRGAWFLANLGLVATLPVGTNLRSRPALEALGIRVLDRPFVAQRQCRKCRRLPGLAVAACVGYLAPGRTRSCRDCARYCGAGRGKEAVRGRCFQRGVTVRHGRC